MEELARELEAAGTRVLRLGDPPAPTCPIQATCAEPLSALPAAVRAQQLALALARRRGLDPDSPPGLRKVTLTR